MAMEQRSKLPWHVSGRMFVTRWLWLLGCRLAQAGTCKACHASKASTVGSGCPPIPGPGVNQSPAPISPISIAIPAQPHWPFHSQHLRQSSLALLALEPAASTAVGVSSLKRSIEVSPCLLPCLFCCETLTSRSVDHLGHSKPTRLGSSRDKLSAALARPSPPSSVRNPSAPRERRSSIQPTVAL